MIEDKEIKEKIMQIVENHWFEDGSIQLVEIADEIITLIQKERKDAIEGFAKWIRPNCDYDLGDFEGYAKEYLESEGK